MASRTFFFAFVAFQIHVYSLRLTGDLVARYREQVGAQDAIELCGEADPDTLKRLDEPCESNDKETASSAEHEPESLRAIFTARGQPDKYRLPAYRLYVCHPNAARKAILFSANGMQIITSDEEMRSMAKLLFTNKLWNLKSTMSESIYRTFKQVTGIIKGREKRDLNSIYLWVLDRDGNIIFAPEIQSGLFYKHGDLTPGAIPWERPVEAVSSAWPETEEVACCCYADAEQHLCKYTFHESVEIGNETKIGLCCKWRAEGCSSISQFRNVMRPSFCQMPTSDDAEKRITGRYRGIARAGGEMRFPDDTKPLLQDKSAYALARLSIEKSDLDPAPGDEASMKKFLKKGAVGAPSLGLCAMGSLKAYMADLGLPVDDVRVAASTFEKNGNEKLATV